MVLAARDPLSGSKPPKKRSYGCLLIVAAVIAMVTIGELVNETTEEPRDYIAPLSTQEEMADFARETLDRLQEQSFASGAEFCGMIYEDEQGRLSATEVTRGDNSACNFSFKWGDGINPVASFHTHGGFHIDYDNEVPSVLDMEQDIKNRVEGFISTPGGRLWRVDWQKERADLVCGEKCLKQDPAYRPCPAYPIAQSYTIEQLKKRSENDPDKC